MRVLDRLIGSQIRRPSGPLGWLLGHLMAQEHRPLTDWTLDFLGLDPAGHLLDIGCGGGMAIQMAAARAESGRVVGVDYAPRMAAQARRRNRALIRAGRAEVVLGSVSALPFPDGAFDQAYSIETFYFWPDPEADLREVLRVVRPGGRVALSMDISLERQDRDAIADNASRLGFTVYDRATVEAVLLAAGFADVSSVAEPSRGKGWLCVRGTRPASQ